jgi:hypothetical protein
MEVIHSGGRDYEVIRMSTTGGISGIAKYVKFRARSLSLRGGGEGWNRGGVKKGLRIRVTVLICLLFLSQASLSILL